MRSIVAAAIAKAAIRAACLAVPAKSTPGFLVAILPLNGIAVGLPVPLTVTFLAPDMAMAAVRRAVVKSCAASLS